MNRPEIPGSQKIFGNAVYWISIASGILALLAPVFILAAPDNNVLNPGLAFGAIFDGAAPQEIWAYSIAGEFPGGHFYLDYLGKADSWAMIIIVIGSAFAMFALVPSVICQLVSEKDWFCAALGAVMVMLIFLSVIGILSI